MGLWVNLPTPAGQQDMTYIGLVQLYIVWGPESGQNIYWVSWSAEGINFALQVGKTKAMLYLSCYSMDYCVGYVLQLIS